MLLEIFANFSWYGYPCSDNLRGKSWQSRENESRDSIRGLTDIPNVGKATAQDLLLLGIQCPQDLIGKDALQMFDELCTLTHQKHDPCVIDVFLAAVDFMEGAPKAPWWDYTPLRKRLLEDRSH